MHDDYLGNQEQDIPPQSVPTLMDIDDDNAMPMDIGNLTNIIILMFYFMFYNNI